MGNIRHTFTSPLRHDHTCHLLYSTYSKYEEDWSSYPHTHYFTELFFVLSGSGSFLVEDETFPIAKHDLIVINPNITQYNIFQPRRPAGIYCTGCGWSEFCH